MAVTYNTSLVSLTNIFTATSGGTVFSANLNAKTAWDYFPDTAVVDDAIYFGLSSGLQSDLSFRIGTALVATSIEFVWEYYKLDVGWTVIEDLEDDTLGFTVLGINRVKFPLQWQPELFTVNGLSRMWVRCRISSVSGLTEGGANITTAVKTSDGRANVSGGTESVPTTFQEVADYLETNYSYINFNHTYNYFDFRKISLTFSNGGYHLTNRETVEIGQGVLSNYKVNSSFFYGIVSGVRIGDRGYNGSTFIFHGINNSHIILTNSLTKMYGANFLTANSSYNATRRYAGYMTLLGEYVDCNIEMAVKLPTVDSSVINCRMVGMFVISSTEVGTFRDVKYLCDASSFLYVYLTGFVLENLEYQHLPSSGRIFYIYQGSSSVSPIWDIVNPKNAFSTMSDAIKPVGYAINTLGAITGFKYYDSATGLYTDYTTEAKNTTDNITMSGEVGDSWLYGIETTETIALGSLSAYFEMVTANSGYEYVLEVYHSGSWVALDTDYIWDKTENLTKTEHLWITTPNFTSLNIDGITAYWIRLRITAKGTTAPVVKRVRRRRCSGVSKWQLLERYSLDIEVDNQDGDPLEGAKVVVSNTDGELFDLTTGVDGKITQQLLTSKKWNFDPEVPTTFIKETIYSDIDLLISKEGYESLRVEGIELSGKIDTTITLKKAVPLLIDSNGESHIRFNKENIGNNRELIG